MQQKQRGYPANWPTKGCVAKTPEAVLAKEREKLAEAEAAIVKLLAQQAEIVAI